VSVEIRIFGSYLVTARPLVAGQIVGSADLLVREGDLGVLPASILTDPDQAIGMQVRSGMAAGLPLRSELLSAPWAVQQGQSVRLLTSGAGFTISNEGKGAEQRRRRPAGSRPDRIRSGGERRRPAWRGRRSVVLKRFPDFCANKKC
jgi:flagella basal body P-ring formation protein FlgA